MAIREIGHGGIVPKVLLPAAVPQPPSGEHDLRERSCATRKLEPVFRLLRGNALDRAFWASQVLAYLLES
jgi:hypothetical protein